MLTSSFFADVSFVETKAPAEAVQLYRIVETYCQRSGAKITPRKTCTYSCCLPEQHLAIKRGAHTERRLVHRNIGNICQYKNSTRTNDAIILVSNPMIDRCRI